MAIIVNSERIEDSAIQKEVERLRPRYEKVFADMNSAEREKQLFEWSKENVIEKVLIKQEGRKNGATILKADVEKVLENLKQDKNREDIYREINANDDEDARKAVESMLGTEHLIRGLYKDLPEPSKEDISKYYEENKEAFQTGEQVRVAHIVKYIDWRADETAAYRAIRKAQDELKEGAVFEAIVNKYTDCEDRGGDLGYIERGKMAEEFEDVVFNLGIGEVSDIFRTRFGFHIAKVYNRKPPAALKLEEVKEQITATLKERIREKAFEDFIDRLKNEAKIEEI